MDIYEKERRDITFEPLMNEVYEVMTAEDCSSGMEAAPRFNPDLLITDVILGGRSGGV